MWIDYTLACLKNEGTAIQKTGRGLQVVMALKTVLIAEGSS